MEHNRENFGAMLKSIIGNLKSVIGSGLTHMVHNYQCQDDVKVSLQLRIASGLCDHIFQS